MSLSIQKTRHRVVEAEEHDPTERILNLNPLPWWMRYGPS
jgi:hypothetical protein